MVLHPMILTTIYSYTNSHLIRRPVIINAAAPPWGYVAIKSTACFSINESKWAWRTNAVQVVVLILTGYGFRF